MLSFLVWLAIEMVEITNWVDYQLRTSALPPSVYTPSIYFTSPSPHTHTHTHTPLHTTPSQYFFMTGDFLQVPTMAFLTPFTFSLKVFYLYHLSDPNTLCWIFSTNLHFLISSSLRPGVKHRLRDLTEFIVWNISGLRQWQNVNSSCKKSY